MPVRRLPRRVNPALAKGRPSAKAAEVVKRALPQRIEAVNPEDMDDGLRMAGSRILEELSNEYENERQLDYVREQFGRFVKNDRMFERAGVPVDVAPTLTDTLGQMSNGVPMPYIDNLNKPGIERRIHTKVVQNPYTGEYEIEPFLNQRTGGALVTELGHNVDMEGEDKASEYIQDHALRLMGFNPTRGPKGKVDFYIEQNGKRIGVDGQTSRTSWNPTVQAYAKVIPTQRESGGYGYGYARHRRNTRANEDALINDIRISLGNEMDGKTGLKRAMNNLIEAGLIKNDSWLRGKAYRADYDKVIMPVVNARDHFKNKDQDLHAIAPDKVIGYDMSDVKDKVDNIKDPNRLNIAYNAAANQKGEGRGQISVDVPRSAIKDVTKENPYVAQLLRILK